MNSSPWIVFAVGMVVKVAIVRASNEVRQGLMLAGLTAFVELLPALASYRNDRQTSSVKTLDSFGRRGDSLVPLGSLLMLASISLGMVVTVGITNSLPPDELGVPQLLSFQVPGLPALSIGDTVLLMSVAPMAFVVGRWMGRALTPNAPMTQGAGNVFAAHICGMVIPMYLVLTRASTESPTFDGSQFLVSTIILMLLLCVSLYGYRRGRKQVLGVYMAHLLDRTSYGDQQDILQLAYDKAVANQAKGGQRVTTLFSG